MKNPNRKNIRGLGTLARRGTTWHLIFSVNGIRYRESSHTDSYNDAVKCLKRRLSEVQTGQFSGTSVDKVLMGELLLDVLADYRMYHPKSLPCFAQPVIARLRAWFGNMKASAVSTARIKGYIAERMTEGAMPATINRELALLRRSFNLGRTQTPPKVVTMPVFKGLMFPEDNARRGFFEHPEYERFRDALPADERMVFMFGYYTCCRWSEVLQLQWEDVDLTNGVALLHAGETKNKEARKIPLGVPGTELYDALAARKALRDTLCPACPWVFFRSENRSKVGKASRQIGHPVRQIRNQWVQAAKDTGVDKLYHDLRRTGARNMRKGGASEGVIMAAGGWKTRAVFERYNIKDDADLHAAAAGMHAFLNSPK